MKIEKRNLQSDGRPIPISVVFEHRPDTASLPYLPPTGWFAQMDAMELLASTDSETGDTSEHGTPGFKPSVALKVSSRSVSRASRTPAFEVACMQDGKLRLILEAGEVGKHVTNRGVTMSINELITPFRRGSNYWMPPNAAWRDISDEVYQRANQRLLQ
jgi:hypothetical protein